MNAASLLVAIELTADSIVTQIIEKFLQRIARIAKRSSLGAMAKDRLNISSASCQFLSASC
jgi:hypothetical protein